MTEINSVIFLVRFDYNFYLQISNYIYYCFLGITAFGLLAGVVACLDSVVGFFGNVDLLTGGLFDAGVSIAGSLFEIKL